MNLRALPASQLATELPTPVAQTCSLLYRRVALCKTSGNLGAWDRSDALPIMKSAIRQIENLRYGKHTPGILPAEESENSPADETSADLVEGGPRSELARQRSTDERSSRDSGE